MPGIRSKPSSTALTRFQEPNSLFRFVVEFRPRLRPSLGSPLLASFRWPPQEGEQHRPHSGGTFVHVLEASPPHCPHLSWGGANIGQQHPRLGLWPHRQSRPCEPKSTLVTGGRQHPTAAPASWPLSQNGYGCACVLAFLLVLCFCWSCFISSCDLSCLALSCTKGWVGWGGVWGWSRRRAFVTLLWRSFLQSRWSGQRFPPCAQSFCRRFFLWHH